MTIVIFVQKDVVLSTMIAIQDELLEDTETEELYILLDAECIETGNTIEKPSGGETKINCERIE